MRAMPALRRGHLRNCVRRLHWRRWLVVQRKAGEAAVERLREEGVDAAEVERARASVVAVLTSEEERGMGSTGPLE